MKISIITVVYNGKKFLENTIKSVLAQTYKNIEYIIIDGDSSDGTVDIIKRYSSNISTWISEKDNGIYDAMNKGISLSTGEYVLFLNAGDDFYDQNVLSNIFDNGINIYEDIVCGASIVVNKSRSTEVYLNPKPFTQFNLLFWTTRTVCHQAIFVKKSVILFYSSKYKLKGELNWYFDLSKKIDSYKIVDMPIVYYSLGGIGDINYKLNTIETFKVIYRQKGIIGVLISLPVTLYKFFRKVFND